MDHVARRPGRALRARPGPSRWVATTALGLLIASTPRPGATRAGEPAAHPDGPTAPKARVASAPIDGSGSAAARRAAPAPAPSTHLEPDPIARARRLIAGCQARYLTVQDYTCTFFKRERIDGKLSAPHIMAMKARTRPSSLYFKFLQPYAGREAIFVLGHNDGKIIAHEVGLARVVAGTMYLDPKGDMAMEENRHPVTEAGLGSMIDLVKGRWDTELHPGESVILFHPQAKVGDRPCLMVESIQPRRGPEFLFHKVKLYVDKDLNLPIRFEAYDWPTRPGAEGDLMEEYTYVNLKLDVGLKDRDFDPKNAQYSYGRF